MIKCPACDSSDYRFGRVISMEGRQLIISVICKTCHMPFFIECDMLRSYHKLTVP